MSWAALSISAVRMEERGMDTRSEIEDRGGERFSAADEERGHSSRHRETMESTITYKNIYIFFKWKSVSECSTAITVHLPVFRR